MSDLISRQAAIDAITDESIVANMDSVFDTELHKCKRATQRILASLPSAQPDLQPTCNQLATDCISRQTAIDALWKALYEYEDKTEKQFQESDELDVGDWIVHRIFVQNMSDIDRQVILNLPSAQSERKKGKWRVVSRQADSFIAYRCSECNELVYGRTDFCPNCGADMRGEANEA